jgi:hypothetical protein
MRRTGLAIFAASLLLTALVLTSCGSGSDKKAAVAEAVPPPAPVKDNRILLLAENQKVAMLVQNHLLGKKVFPGGTLGEYDDGDRKYQLFIISTASPQDAAILLLDTKVTMGDPQYIAYMGGYYGTDAGKPFYVFADKQYLAGVVGLPEDLADPIARQLAARLR